MLVRCVGEVCGWRCVGEVCGGGVDTSGVVLPHSSHNLTCTQTCIHTDTDSKKHLFV